MLLKNLSISRSEHVDNAFVFFNTFDQKVYIRAFVELNPYIEFGVFIPVYSAVYARHTEFERSDFL